ncbi:MAG: hypothetical protein A4E62_01085 [Syntrophorhabdus sp. PtaU1.Bin002]|nr:MAG: hypothetical protein A4E58_02916 [Syntrophorhabdus sp. PtaB.Bin006]OPY71894.1 MAG: hypothetical protein A4E62_01085 [Syntrophorhabdus sp. PtaU1.Bin002]
MSEYPKQTCSLERVKNRISLTIPFARHASDLTRHHVPICSMLQCEDSMARWCSVVFRKDRLESYCHSPESARLCRTRSPIGTPGITHSHVTGPQVVPQCSLKEQPSLQRFESFAESYSDSKSIPMYYLTPAVNENILCSVVKGWTSTTEVEFQFGIHEPAINWTRISQRHPELI